MPSLVTNKFRRNNADQFFESFSEASPTVMYMFIGRVRNWSNDFDPPTPIESVANVEYEHWNDMIAAKRTNSTDVSYAAARTNWVTGTVYTEYSDKVDLTNTNYFVLTDAFNVYKCLFNNNGTTSTVKPTGTSTSVITTSDKYKWKFMYTVSAADALKWVTTNFIPITTLTSDGGTTQWDVQQAAANSAVEVIDVTAGGSVSNFTANTFATANSSTNLQLATDASTTSDIYNGSVLYITGGTGAGQQKQITTYNGPDRVATVNNAFSPVPTAASTYAIAPLVVIGGDGSGATAVAVVNTGSSTVESITVTAIGQDYTTAPITVSGNGVSGVTATAYIGPPGGHGSDAITELNGFNVMLNTKFDKTESGDFTTGNDFRKIGVLRDPQLSTDAVATGSTYNQALTLNISSVTGSFLVDEIVTGGSSTAVGNVIDANSSIIRLTNVTGTYNATETVTGPGGGSATLDSITATGLVKYTGDVLYIEQRSPVARASDQIEDIKLVIQF